MKIVAISDVVGGARSKSSSGHFEESFDALYSNSIKYGSISKVPDVEPISNKELLESEVDILIPAALENQITDENVRNIRAKIVVEAANGPQRPLQTRCSRSRAQDWSQTSLRILEGYSSHTSSGCKI